MPTNELDNDKLVQKYLARIRQLEREILSRKEENDLIAAENLRQNEELHELNQALDQKVVQRTRQLEEANDLLKTQKQQLEKLGEIKEALMHMIVHDMKNPLTVILGSLKLLCKLEGPSQELSQNAFGQARKLFSMIEQILDISRMQSREFIINPIRFDLGELAWTCVETMKGTIGEKKVEIRLKTTAPQHPVFADECLIERVINNLINNALKYALAGSEVLVGIFEKPDATCLEVSNAGEIIPEAYRERVFEMFGRVNPQDTTIRGTGLGLTFVKLVMDAHQGNVGLESPVPELGNGARFTICIPKNLPSA